MICETYETIIEIMQQKKSPFWTPFVIFLLFYKKL